MNCADGSLNCAWGYVPAASPYYSMSIVTGAGPAGQNVVRNTHTPQPAGAPQVQYYHGWVRSNVESPPAQGSTRYIRFWIKPLAPFNLQGTGDIWGTKFIILGDGGTEGTRVICNLRDDGPVTNYQGNGLMIHCARNIDGNAHGAGGFALVSDQWNWVQIEIRSSSSASATDARIAMWLNQANYNSPTSQSNQTMDPWTLSTSAWNNVTFGWYAGTALSSQGRLLYDVGGFEYATHFDAAWAPSGTPPPPPPPSGPLCDINRSGGVDVSDVQLCVNQSIGISTCSTADINGDTFCNVVDVQRVVNAATGSACVTQ